MILCTYIRVNVKHSYPLIYKQYSKYFSGIYVRKYKSKDKTRILLAVTVLEKTCKHIQFIINAENKELLHVIIDKVDDENAEQRYYSIGCIFFHSEFSSSDRKNKLKMIGDKFELGLDNRTITKRHIHMMYLKCRLRKLLG